MITRTRTTTRPNRMEVVQADHRVEEDEVFRVEVPVEGEYQAVVAARLMMAEMTMDLLVHQVEVEVEGDLQEEVEGDRDLQEEGEDQDLQVHLVGVAAAQEVAAATATATDQGGVEEEVDLTVVGADLTLISLTRMQPEEAEAEQDQAVQGTTLF